MYKRKPRKRHYSKKIKFMGPYRRKKLYKARSKRRKFFNLIGSSSNSRLTPVSKPVKRKKKKSWSLF